jgi:hypothetical protein
MSNIIDSQLRVEGPRETLELFKNSFAVININGEVIDVNLDLLFPVPQKLQSDSATEKQKELGNRLKRLLWGISTWCSVDESANYKVYEIESEKTDLYRFSSSWNGPISFVLNASIIFEELKFSLNCFDICNHSAEKYTISNGEVNSSEIENVLNHN